MGFINWVKNHVVASVAIVVFPVALIICGVSMLNSKKEYDKYVVEYNANVLNTKANSPVNPNDVLTVDSFTSKYAKSFTAKPSDFVLPEGKENAIVEENGISYIGNLNDAKYEVTLNMNFEKTAYCDVSLELATSYVKNNVLMPTDDLMAVVSIKINDVDIAGEIKLDVEEDGEDAVWTTMVIKGIALPKGTNTLTISPLSEAESVYMPKIKNAVVYSDANVTF